MSVIRIPNLRIAWGVWRVSVVSGALVPGHNARQTVEKVNNAEQLSQSKTSPHCARVAAMSVMQQQSYKTKLS